MREKEQDLFQRCQMGFDLESEGGVMGSLKNDFDWFRMLVRRCGEDAPVTACNDRAICPVGIDFRTDVPWKER